MLSVHNRSREKWVHSRGNGPFSTRCVIVFRTGEENDPNDRVHSRRRADKGGVAHCTTPRTPRTGPSSEIVRKALRFPSQGRNIDLRPAACHHVNLGVSLLRAGCGSNSRQSSLNPWRRRKSNSLEPVCAAHGVEEFSVICVRSNANGFASPRLQGEEARLVRFPTYRDAESGRLTERR